MATMLCRFTLISAIYCFEIYSVYYFIICAAIVFVFFNWNPTPLKCSILFDVENVTQVFSILFSEIKLLAHCAFSV